MSEPATKADLEKAIAGAINELKEHVDNRTKELKEYIDERTHDAETRLLRGFVDYSSSSDVRIRKLERETQTFDSTTTERLGELERRVTALDIRVLRLENGSK